MFVAGIILLGVISWSRLAQELALKSGELVLFVATATAGDEEMQRLHKFVNYENENLLWWTITGNGGTGKSRLALELCYELDEQDWYAGFLTTQEEIDILSDWKPTR